jgi:hypothetical protein
MSEIGKRIAAVVDSGLGPLLKEQGFRRNGINYHRNEGDGIQVVTIQSSQRNYAESGKFRINFGVHFPEVAKVLHGSDMMPKIPRESSCILRAIGSFPDRWWKIDSAADTASLASNLRLYWLETVWPWLESNKRLPDAAKTLESTNRAAAAAARLVLGQRDEAVRLVKVGIADLESALESQLTHPANAELIEGHIQNLRGWAARHDLL